MSDTSSKKNSVFDKVLLGVAGALAIGMLAAGPRKEHKPAPDKEEVAQNESDEKEEKAKVKVTKVSSSEAQKKIAAMQEELAKTKRANADLKVQLESSNMALTMQGGDSAAVVTNKKELKKAKASLESMQAEIKALKDSLAKAQSKAPAKPEDNMAQVESAKKAAAAERKRKEELIKTLEKALEEAKSGK